LATAGRGSRWTLVRIDDSIDYRWRAVDTYDELPTRHYAWANLIDPVVLHEGWTP
jgi:hypothetical protein